MDWQAEIKNLAEVYTIDDVERFTHILINLKRFYNVQNYVDKDNKRKLEDTKKIEIAL